MMALGLFIHNAILTIVKKNRCQENNVRLFKIAQENAAHETVDSTQIITTD